MPKKIIVADDDPAIAEGVVMLLSEYGYRAQAIMDGNELLKLHENLPDLVLLDVWMSGHDGRDICRRLKQNNKTKHIPVILFSASRDIKQSAQESGANDFIEKPFEMDELIDKIETNIN